MAARDWTNLPCELLPLIADRLAEIEALPDHEPSFLLYGGNNSQYKLVTDESHRKYAITIPELDGATCLASNQGWLFLFREGSMFFFCPFSRAKIDLPGKLPHSVVSDDHVAVFSPSPPSQDCVNVLLTMMEFFYFFDNMERVVYFSTEDTSLSIAKVRYSRKEKCLPLRFITDSEKNEMKKRLGLGDEFPLSTCGTIVSTNKADKMIPYETTGNIAIEAGCNPLKGVWF
ncbi:hypothetical protein PTKIN_Ptkin15bG0082500 [Pterospermum kingtungense]